MKRLHTFLTCLFVGFSFQIFAQQLSLFTQYRENQSIINPASVSGSYLTHQQNLTFGASYRAQWAGLENAPTTATLRGEYLYTGGGTVSLIAGGYLINDQTGPTGFTGLYGRIGGLLSSDPEYAGISIGLSAGAVQYRVNTSEITLRDEGDILSGDDQNKLFPDVGVGVFAYSQLDNGGFFDGDYLYGGISIPQAIGLDLTFKEASGEFYTKRVQHFYGMLGLYKFFSNDGFIEPSVWVKYVANAPINVDVNLRYQMAENFWIGAGGASSKAMHVETGILLGDNIGLDNTLRIGYGFDYNFSTFGPYARGSHEINISYSLEK